MAHERAQTYARFLVDTHGCSRAQIIESLRTAPVGRACRSRSGPISRITHCSRPTGDDEGGDDDGDEVDVRAIQGPAADRGDGHNYLHWILSQSHAGCWAWRNGYVTSALQAAAREELARRGNPLWQPPAVLPTVANVPGVGQVPWHVIAVAFRDDALALPREVM
jgi:hypothetical protein